MHLLCMYAFGRPQHISLGHFGINKYFIIVANGVYTLNIIINTPVLLEMKILAIANIINSTAKSE